MNEKRLKEIAWRHHHTLITDWAKEFDPLAQTQSYNNARECHQDRAELIAMIEELQGEIEGLLMDRGRRDAKIAVLLSVLAKLAREGQQEYAQEILKKSDEAWTNVKREHLVVAHINSKALENSTDE